MTVEILKQLPAIILAISSLITAVAGLIKVIRKK